ncbi:hypothetical protein LCGC14_2551890 [marine sediment metagenome]|uniref:Uncharacterized protein n=1 Tax=marine sediment metagenome TaxID=412755 RepID=A0A0F9BAJ8_9ZZZZ
MGEMANYMLNGDDCESCGDYIGPGPGYPRNCAACQPEADRSEKEQKRKRAESRKAKKNPTGPFVLRKRDRAWLAMVKAATDHHSGLYNGLSIKEFPTSPRRRLLQADLVAAEIPNNDVHHTRYIITDQGREILKATE